MEQTEIIFSPFAQLESDAGVQGASSVGVSLYNQLAFIRYMRRLTSHGVDQLDYSIRVRNGMQIQAAMHRRFATKIHGQSVVHRLKKVVR